MSGLLLIPLGVVAYAWYGALACAVCSLWTLAEPESRWRSILGGVLAGMSLSFRPDIGPAVILANLVLLYRCPFHQQWRFALGAAAGLLPLAIVLLVAGPEQTFSNLFLYPVIRSGPGRRLPFSTVDADVLRLFFAVVLAAIVNLIAGIREVRASREPRRGKAFLALAVLGAAIIPQAWQRLDSAHLHYVAFLSVGLLPLGLFSFFARTSEKRTRGWLAFAMGAVALLVVAGTRPSVLRRALAGFQLALQTSHGASAFVERGSRSFPVGSPEKVAILDQLLDEVTRSSKPGERLFVGPGDLRRTNYCDTFLYHLLPQLRPATYFLEMNPLSANRPGSRLASDIATADWLILNHAWDVADEPNRSVEYGSDEPFNIVRDHFEMRGRYGSYGLFHRVR